MAGSDTCGRTAGSGMRVAAPLARVPLAGAQARTALHLDVPGLFKQRARQCAHAHGAPRLSRTYASDPTQVICVSSPAPGPSQLSAFPVTAAGLANGVVMRGCIISNLSVYTTLLE